MDVITYPCWYQSSSLSAYGTPGLRAIEINWVDSPGKHLCDYRQTSDVSDILIGNKSVVHSGL